MAVSTSTKMLFSKITCPQITLHGDPIFATGDNVTTWISDSAFAQGSMKAVYEIAVINQPHDDTARYVAKRFFKLQDDSWSDLDNAHPLDLTKVPAEFLAEAHNAQIQHEQTCLARGTVFIKSFYKFCHENGVDEVGDPSPASGMKRPAPELENNQGASTESIPMMGLMWLIEKRHPSQRIQRFSRTLEHATPHSDQLHLTIYALQRFIYRYSNNELVFADLQGTPVTTVGRNGDLSTGTVLFDPMTCTRTQGSGIGNHGPNGIQTFVEQHQCRELCDTLDLGTQFLLNPGKDDTAGYQLGDSGSDPGHVGDD
ncbi:hypothetical protein FA15DRAFT_710110 [Coprinopsis marcescibilis]|uniref:Alpha-type protein kinase domain-containing protein n=1 Tax=Coprinopsis marcescibilis TaxID=230819 RepID=A0A5C3KDK3_COPMA|nr:hypothetical protein FA15DRAFT_710110 [Coprinopsis marcescibilis]